MTSASARMAGVTAALYFGYQVVAGLLTALTQLSTLLSQHPGGADLTLWWVGFVPRAMPYVIAAFLLFWLWPAKGQGILVGQLPSMLLNGIDLNFPVLALAAIVNASLFRAFDQRERIE